jgi:hypothetical protein
MYVRMWYPDNNTLSIKASMALASALLYHQWLAGKMAYICMNEMWGTSHILAHLLDVGKDEFTQERESVR